MEKKILLDKNYILIKNVRDAYIEEEVIKRFTDYFLPYDYVLGDWAYGKLRLKGFNNKDNSNFKEINDFKKVDDYLQNYCANECKYFILQKESDESIES